MKISPLSIFYLKSMSAKVLLLPPQKCLVYNMPPPPCLSISLIMEEDECDYVATEKEIRECELDIVAGEKVDSLWLILDNKYILLKKPSI